MLDDRRGLEEALHLFDGERLGEEARLAGQVQVRGDIEADQVLAEREAVEATDGGGAPPEARRAERETSATQDGLSPPATE